VAKVEQLSVKYGAFYALHGVSLALKTARSRLLSAATEPARPR